MEKTYYQGKCKMTRKESYIQEYNKMNHAYNQIFDSLEIISQADNPDKALVKGLNYTLNLLSNLLDVIKEEKNQVEEDTSETNTKKEKKSFKGWKVH